MRLLGLPTTYVSALIGGGLVAVVLLYLRQWGRRRVVVSFSPLWKRVLSEADVGTSRRRVLELFSLLLQAAVVVLLALALGRPLVGRAPGTQAIVLDTSASMLAQKPPRGDRLAAAKQRALELLDRFSDEDRVALVTTGGDARLVFAPTRDHYALRERIASTEPCACEGRLREAVELARGVMPDGGAIYVLTDGNESLEGDTGKDLHVELFGAPAANMGITLFGVRAAPAQPGRYEAALELSNFSPGNARAQLRISIDGQLVDLRDVHLDPNEHQRVPLPSLFAGRGESLLKAELFNIEFAGHASGSVDALKEDNVGYALLAPEAERPIRLLAPPDGGRFVREALLANPRYHLIEPDAQHPDAGAGAITVVDGSAVPQGPGRYLVLAPPPGAPTIALDDALITDWRSDHPLLRHVSFEGIHIRAGRATTPPAGAQILARFGNVPLLYVREATERIEIGTTFDAEDSNLPMRVAFPVFVYSAIDWLAGIDEAEADKALGHRWRLERLGAAAPKRLTIEGPSRHAEVSVRGDAVIVDGANAPGLYRITVDDEVFRIAASLASPQESNLVTRAAFTSMNAQGSATDLWSWLLYAALGVLFLEWALYHRRVTS
jgi:hypothetical protein